ncbi:chloride channel protein 3 [Decorospora gaudefroyi]|uniref:Chloride channel protein n=1 Tax=Decorospora gaudefroyi TaxID=184978 RepID=A0A6A5K8M8_9PLEO|nr:chloride channel protein 3 [Decorospora gaudefroyi]
MNRSSSSGSRARQASQPRASQPASTHARTTSQPRPGHTRRQSSRSTSFAPSLRRRATAHSIHSLNIDDEDPESANTTNADAAIVEEIAEIKRYEDFTTIDWVQDAAREQLRRKSRRRERASIGNQGRNIFLGRGRGRWRRKIAEAYDAGQAWIVVTLVGAAIGLNAGFLNIVTEWLSDIKLGHCTTAFYLNESFCCWGAESGCPEWKTWSSFWPANYLFYILFAALFSFTAARLVKSFAPYAAGSGISEMKCIIAGFVMKGFLGFTTLFIKSIGLPLAIASGLSVGKEGPSVHYAVCTGNVVSRFFDKYRRNAAKTREILSASAAAGVGVAFGSPIGGVLFSLEEMSNNFPLKTLWRSYFCALVATAVLAAMNPFRTGQLVMFNVSYDRSWHFFEITFYLLIGVFGGLYGALVIKWNLKMQVFRKKYLSAYPITEAVTLAVLTAVICYPNMFLRIDMTESMEILFQECEGDKGYDRLCDVEYRWHNVWTLTIATIIRTLLVIISFGCKVPAGIFVPSMAIGAAFGRTIGILVQALHETFPTSPFFSACAPDGPCITPGTYAFLGAAAALSGIMHITVSVVVIMFEITGALTYILPTMIVVGVTKAVSERFGHGGIADRMIYLNGYPFLDSKVEHSFGVPVSQVMCTKVVCLSAQGMDLREIERVMGENRYQGFPIVDAGNQRVLVGYIGRTELRYAIERAKTEHSGSGKAKCFFTSPPSATASGNSMSTASTTSAQATLDFTRFVDPTPLAVHPRLPLETVMEVFGKMGPRVILIEYRGRLAGLVTVKDCLRYQFKVEAGHGGGSGGGGGGANGGVNEEGMERVAEWGRKVINWGRRKLGMTEVGELRLVSPMSAGGGGGGSSSRGLERSGDGDGEDGRNDVPDVELEDRRAGSS